MLLLTFIGLIISIPLLGSGSPYSDPTLSPHPPRFGSGGTCARVLWKEGNDQAALSNLQTALVDLATRGEARIWELTALDGQSTQRKLVVETSADGWATLLGELKSGRWAVEKNRVYPIAKSFALVPTAFGLRYTLQGVIGVAYFFRDDPVLELLTSPVRWLFSPPMVPPGAEVPYVYGKVLAMAFALASAWIWTIATDHYLEAEVGKFPATGESVPFYILKGMRDENFYKNRRRVPVRPDAIPFLFSNKD